MNSPVHGQLLKDNCLKDKTTVNEYNKHFHLCRRNWLIFPKRASVLQVSDILLNHCLLDVLDGLASEEDGGREGKVTSYKFRKFTIKARCDWRMRDD